MEAVDRAATQLNTAVQSVLANPWVQSGKRLHVDVLLFDDSTLTFFCSTSTLIFSVEHLPGLHSGRQICGSDLESVLQQPLVVPVLMPRVSLDMGDLRIEPRTQSTPPSSAILIHVQSRLRDATVGESREWDLKFWYIDRAAMWEGADRFWDEITELMWSLHKWFKAVSHTNYRYERTLEWQAFCGVLEVARRYRRRFILPKVPLHHPTSRARLLEGLPTLRESLLFRAWVKRSPPDSVRNRVAEAMDTA